MPRLPALLILLAALLPLQGCFWLLVGGEAGYVAGQKKSAGETVSDQWIHAKVKSSLVAEPKVAARNINVDVDNGIVKLKGVVSSREERAAAVATARGVQGVRKVIDKLHVEK